MSAAGPADVEFVKMHGAGNDYVFLDGLTHRELTIELAAQLAAPVADRHFGLGSDGLILVTPATADGDARMVMWNADGSRGEMCGNGLRCAAKLVAEYLSRAPCASNLTIETDAGLREVQLVSDAADEFVSARIAMGRVAISAIATTWPVPGFGEQSYFTADVGVPHAVVFVDERGAALDARVHAVGSTFQAAPPFRASRGVNVNFVTEHSADRLAVRTFERGSGETLACGSGATAAAAVARRLGYAHGSRIRVAQPGGELVVQFDPTTDDGDVSLLGPIRTVYRGSLNRAELDRARRRTNSSAVE